MSRGPRLDAANVLHHVFARGIERRAIFVDDRDRDDFLERLGAIARDGGLRVYAWALMLNHVHLLVRTGNRPLERSMRSLLAGYATQFNRRHDRVGHLFQNRYRSIVCEDEPYFLTLVRYIHRNPIPSIVPDIASLSSYPYTGHSALLEVVPRDWQDTAEVLERFGSQRDQARKRYLDFVNDEAAAKAQHDLDGGGLVRSLGSWAHVSRLEKGRERFRSDERILGTPRFVERCLSELNKSSCPLEELEDVVRRVCVDVGLAPDAVRGDGRPHRVSDARKGIAYLWTVRLGRSGRALARHLGVVESAVHKAARRGAQQAQRWDPLLEGPAGDEK